MTKLEVTRRGFLASLVSLPVVLAAKRLGIPTPDIFGPVLLMDLRRAKVPLAVAPGYAAQEHRYEVLVATTGLRKYADGSQQLYSLRNLSVQPCAVIPEGFELEENSRVFYDLQRLWSEGKLEDPQMEVQSKVLGQLLAGRQERLQEIEDWSRWRLDPAKRREILGG